MPQQADLEPMISVDDVNALLASVYPQLNGDYASYRALEVFPGGCRVRLDADERHLRPGGTVSGPSLFTLADIGGYVCVLSHAGPDALSVTTSLNINFVRKAAAGPVDGPPVLCLHGFPEGWMSWRPVMRELGEARLYALDLRGYGGTERAPRG